MSQANFILKILERICRSNIYLFIITRFLVGKYLAKTIYDSDFKIINILKKNNFFVKKKINFGYRC